MSITHQIVVKLKELIDSAEHLDDVGVWYYSELPAALKEIEELRQIGIVDLSRSAVRTFPVLGIPEVQEEQVEPVVVEVPVETKEVEEVTETAEVIEEVVEEVEKTADVVEVQEVVEATETVEATEAVETNEPVVDEATAKPKRNSKNKG